MGTLITNVTQLGRDLAAERLYTVPMESQEVPVPAVLRLTEDRYAIVIEQVTDGLRVNFLVHDGSWAVSNILKIVTDPLLAVCYERTLIRTLADLKRAISDETLERHSVTIPDPRFPCDMLKGCIVECRATTMTCFALIAAFRGSIPIIRTVQPDFDGFHSPSMELTARTISVLFSGEPSVRARG